jgi:hypothetical protein
MEPKTLEGKFISHRYAPGYRDVDILIELNGVETVIHLDKESTQRLSWALSEVIRTAGKNPIDSEKEK